MRGAPILFALAALALAPRPAAAALMQWDGTLTLLSSLAAEEITAEVSGVAVVLDAGNGYTLKTLRLLGTQAGSGVFLVTDPETIGEGVAAVRLEASVGFGTLSPFDPLASLSSPQLVAGQLPLRGVEVALNSSRGMD